MPVDFREYDYPRKHKSKKRQGFPLVRLLILLIVVFYFWYNGYFFKTYEFFFPPIQPNATLEKQPLSWQEQCASVHGKSFLLRDSVGQCSWQFNEGGSGVYDHDFWRYLVEVETRRPLKIHWVAPIKNFNTPWFLSLQVDSLERNFFRVFFKLDSSFVWIEDGTLCRFPGFCPENPLEGGALPIPHDFDFEGRESLLMKDQFMGIGETPIYPILPGRVIMVARDSSDYNITIDHGDNLTSRVSGAISIASDLKEGQLVEINEPIARLAPKDRAIFYLEVIRNGQFVRWDAFFNETHPVTKEIIAKFRKEIGF